MTETIPRASLIPDSRPRPNDVRTRFETPTTSRQAVHSGQARYNNKASSRAKIVESVEREITGLPFLSAILLQRHTSHSLSSLWDDILASYMCDSAQRVIIFLGYVVSFCIWPPSLLGFACGYIAQRQAKSSCSKQYFADNGLLRRNNSKV